MDQLVEAIPLTNVTILWMNHLALSILTYDRTTIHFIILLEHTILLISICYIIKLIKGIVIERISYYYLLIVLFIIITLLFYYLLIVIIIRIINMSLSRLVA